MDPMIFHFPKPHEGLEWLQRSAEEWANFSEKETGKRNENLVGVYRYIKWSSIYRRCPPMSDERTVAYGLMLKYYWIIHLQDPPTADRMMIEKAERALKLSNEAIRAKKGKADGH